MTVAPSQDTPCLIGDIQQISTLSFGCSNQAGFGKLLVGENAISKIACKKISGSQNTIGIVDLMCPRYAS
jgi:hypothetical protein